MVDLRGLDVVKPVLVATIATALTTATLPHLVVQKVCHPSREPSQFDGFICRDEALVREATDICSYRNIVRSISSALSLVFFGAWRDSTGRSIPLLLIGEVAELASSAIYVFASWNWQSSAWISTMTEAVIGGLFGQNVLQLGANCLVIKNSDAKGRIIKLQIYLVSLSLGIIVADTVSGFLLTQVGFKWFYPIVIAIHGVAILLVLFAVKDRNPERGSRGGFAATLGQIKVLLKKRPNRSVVWLMLICNALVTTYISAEGTLTVYYTQHAFNFTVKQANLYVTYHTVICIVGAIILPIIFVRFFKWRYFKIGLATSSMTTVSSVALAFVKTSVELYLVSLLDVTKFVMYAIPQSIIANCVRNEELGLYLGFGSIVGIGLPFAINYLYSQTFNDTYKTMPGTIFFITASANIIVIIILSISYYFYTPQEPPVDTEDPSTVSN